MTSSYEKQKVKKILTRASSKLQGRNTERYSDRQDEEPLFFNNELQYGC